MAIFSRRILQRLIHENSTVLKLNQTRKLVKRMNRGKEDALGAEWETVLINAFGRLGRVDYEPKLGPKSPDILYTSSGSEGASLLLDVVTVSDIGLDAKHPVETLNDKLLDKAAAKGIRPNSFVTKIDGDTSGLPGPPRMEVLVFNEKFDQYLQEICRYPKTVRQFECRLTNVTVRIVYDPSLEFGARSYPSYTQAVSVTHNNVFEQLEEKTNQLVRSHFQGPKGIILCDGSCGLLWTDFGSDCEATKIVQHFLRGEDRINFVALCLTPERRDSRRLQPRVSILVFEGKRFDSLSPGLAKDLRALHSKLPQPERTAGNAANLLKFTTKQGNLFGGGWRMSDTEIKLSLRVLMNLMSGRVSQQVFLEQYPLLSPFIQKRLSEGRLVDKIEVEKTDHDDDWVVFTFGGRDAAISDFTCYPVKSD